MNNIIFAALLSLTLPPGVKAEHPPGCETGECVRSSESVYYTNCKKIPDKHAEFFECELVGGGHIYVNHPRKMTKKELEDYKVRQALHKAARKRAFDKAADEARRLRLERRESVEKLQMKFFMVTHVIAQLEDRQVQIDEQWSRLALDPLAFPGRRKKMDALELEMGRLEMQREVAQHIIDVVIEDQADELGVRVLCNTRPETLEAAALCIR